MNSLQKTYKIQKNKIKSRLNEFKNLKEKEYYKELLFCFLTPQSNAQRCWKAVQELSLIKNPSKEQITKTLSTKTRFHNTKANYIHTAPKTYQALLPILSNPNKLALRNQIASQTKGLGLKEASHFLRNIGHSNNQIAILDRHILKNLKENSLIKETKIKSPKHYLEIEQIFLNFSKTLNIPADELDLLLWSKENGKIFK